MVEMCRGFGDPEYCVSIFSYLFHNKNPRLTNVEFCRDHEFGLDPNNV